jgi:hypothetical protein
MPTALLTLLKKFAEREGIGYQVLIKRWLDDRVREERDRMRQTRAQTAAGHRSRAPEFSTRRPRRNRPIVDVS